MRKSVFCSIFLIALSFLHTECKGSSNSWSFLSESESYLKINGTKNSDNTLTFRFKSHDYNARLLLGIANGKSIALDLDEGFLQVSVRGQKISISGLQQVRVNDMQWHKIKLVLDSIGVTISLDNLGFFLALRRPGPHKLLRWEDIWFGQAAGKEKKDSMNRVSNSFVGCLHLNEPNSRLQGQQENSVLDKGRFVVNGCLDACVIQTCANGGQCINRVNHAICDCLGTGYDGPTCEQESPVIFMNGASFMAFDTAENPVSNNEELFSMRIRTKDPEGVVLTTSFAKDRLHIQLVAGKVEVSLDFGGASVKFESSKAVNDDQWHSIKLHREARVVSLHLDSKLVGSTTLTSPMAHFQMTGGEELIYIGGVKRGARNHYKSTAANFTGCLQQVRVNNIDIIHSVLYLRDWRVSFYGDKSKTCPKR